MLITCMNCPSGFPGNPLQPEGPLGAILFNRDRSGPCLALLKELDAVRSESLTERRRGVKLVQPENYTILKKVRKG